ncbi:MAG: hypothetical protein DRN96_09870 [Thermoproteota archaeon]|nr:MAG: hypothetical protein DRN96_09870 [Candidatus Korarchaeota archaeon]
MIASHLTTRANYPPPRIHELKTLTSSNPTPSVKEGQTNHRVQLHTRVKDSSLTVKVFQPPYGALRSKPLWTREGPLPSTSSAKPREHLKRPWSSALTP